MKYIDPSALFAFYAGAKHSPELQSQHDAMQTWSAQRLAAAVPAWAKPKMIAPFRYQLSQKFPAWCARYATREPWHSPAFYEWNNAGRRHALSS